MTRMMQLRLFSIAIFFVMLSFQVAYADYIQGHVVLLDRESGFVDIIICEGCTSDEECSVEAGHMAKHGEGATQVHIVVSWIPRCLTEGMMIFARGVFAEDDSSRFEAVDVFPCKRMGGKDKTGVRSRCS